MGAKVVLNWTNASYNLVTQAIQRKVGEGQFAALKDVPPVAQHTAETLYTYEDTTISTKVETTYVYRIVSISSGGQQVNGNEFSIVIPASTVAVTDLDGEFVTE